MDPKHTLLGAYVLYPSCRNLGRASRCLSQVAGGSIVGLPTRSASKKKNINIRFRGLSPPLDIVFFLVTNKIEALNPSVTPDTASLPAIDV